VGRFESPHQSCRENAVAIVFAAILIVLVVGRSYWIMLDLDYRMAP